MSTPPATEKFVCGCAFTYCYHFDVDQVSGIREAKIDAGPTLEEVRAELAKLHTSLEEQIRETYADLDEDGDQEIYSFDSGFIAGIRCALNGLANVRRNV